MMIKFEKVSKRFFKDGPLILNEVSFSLKKGEFVFLVGPSGAGKTTILRLLLREILPSEGKIFIEGEDIVSLPKRKIFKLRRKIGVVFQDYKLLIDRNVFENVALPLEILGEKTQTIKEKVRETLARVGLKNKEKFFPLQLSGGEFQRTAIARAIVSSPPILFADEPTGNLDPANAQKIVELLKKINAEGTTVIMATHNAQIVNSLSQRVIRLEKGKIISDKKKGKYTDD